MISQEVEEQKSQKSNAGGSSTGSNPGSGGSGSVGGSINHLPAIALAYRSQRTENQFRWTDRYHHINRYGTVP